MYVEFKYDWYGMVLSVGADVTRGQDSFYREETDDEVDIVEVVTSGGEHLNPDDFIVSCTTNGMCTTLAEVLEEAAIEQYDQEKYCDDYSDD